MRKLIVIAGPERSGTRFITYLISLVQGVYGMNAYKHDEGAQDLDIVWQHLREENFDTALQEFNRIVPDEGHVLTRRCYPHGSHWDNISRMARIVSDAGFELFVVVLTRDVNIISHSMDRIIAAHHRHDTTKGRITRAYKNIFAQIEETGAGYCIFNYESLIALGKKYLKKIVEEIGLKPKFDKEIEPLLEDGNKKYITCSDAPNEFDHPELYPKYITENPGV